MGGERVRAVNADTAVACHKFVVARTDHRGLVERLRIGGNRPVRRFNVAPGYQRNPDGTTTRMEGEILHSGYVGEETGMPPLLVVRGDASRALFGGAPQA